METKKQERWFITKFFCEKSEPSSKRLVGIVGSFTLFATLFANSFTHIENAPSAPLVDAVALLSFGALGITGLEKVFGKKGTVAKNEENSAE
jgi:hypothetical protein